MVDKKLGWLWFMFMRNREWSQWETFPAPHQTVLCPLFFRNIAINLEAHPLGTYETKMAARTRKRSIQTILEQKRGL